MRKVLIAAAVAVASLTWSMNAAAEGPLLRFASFPPSNSSINKQVFEPWVERLNAAADGNMRIQLFSGGTLGRSPRQQHKLVRDGIAQIGYVSMSSSPGEYPDAVLFELPFFIENATEGSIAHWRLHQQGKVRGLSDVRVIGAMIIPPYGLHGAMPLSQVENLKGKKIRVGGAVQSAIADALGAVPVGGIAVTSLAESLSRGVVDGTLADWNGVRSFRLHEVTKNHLDVPLGGLAVAIVMNAAAYDALPAKAKAVLDELGGESFSRFWGETLDRVGREISAEVTKADGQAVSVAKGEVWEAYREAVAPVTERWLQDNPDVRESYEALSRILTDVRAGR